MTTVQEALVSLLRNEGLTVYPLAVPNNGTYPNVCYQRVSNPQYRTHSGVYMERPRVQLSCWGENYADCVATAQTVTAALDLNQSDFALATKENEMDAVEVETGLYRILLEFFIYEMK
jgi:hypothetical protein